MSMRFKVSPRRISDRDLDHNLRDCGVPHSRPAGGRPIRSRVPAATMSLATFTAMAAAALVQPAIQPATRPQQVSAAAALCVDCFVTLRFPQFQRSGAVQEWAAALEQRGAAGSHTLLVAPSRGADDEVIGCVECGMLPPPPEMRRKGAPPPPPRDPDAPPPPDVPYLANLAVAPGARRQGLGKDLVLATEELAASWGHDQLYIKVDRQNFEARRLYDRLGYEFVFLQNLPADWNNAQRAFLFLRKAVPRIAE